MIKLKFDKEQETKGSHLRENFTLICDGDMEAPAFQITIKLQ